MARRSFEAPTLLEAVRASRSALGPEALVIAARRLPASRWPWGRRQPCIRIVAEAPRQADAALLVELGRLADEMADLRRAVEVLEQSGLGKASPVVRPRTVRVVRNPSATPGSVDAWSRESSNS